MTMADRIQSLRKSNGISQEQLADKIGVSRQAVSKWESGQSTPDIEKIIILSELFDVSTDYILRGIEAAGRKEHKNNSFPSQVLYIASTAFIAIGMFCAFGGWYEKQTMESVWGAMVIQAVGLAGYFIGKLLSADQTPFYVSWLNVTGVAFMPVSMLTGYLSILIFKQGWVSPYPAGIVHSLIFGVSYTALSAVSFLFLKKRTGHQN